MLTVHLADDEPVILRGLRKLLDWDRLGLQIIGESRNGEDLMRAIELSSPHLVITDIAMPRMDGIEVLKQIRSRGLPTKVVFISAYREFSYAQDALSYGAAGYLIKPVSRPKLEEIVLKAIAGIHNDSLQVMNEKKLRELELQQQHISLLEDLRKFVEEKTNVPNSEMITAVGGDDPAAAFSVLAIDPDLSRAAAGRWGEGQRRLLFFAIQNIIEETLGDREIHWTFLNEGRFYVIVRHAPLQEMDEMVWTIHRHINDYVKQEVTVCVSGEGSLLQLPQLYRHCSSAIDYRYFAGTNRIFSCHSLPQTPWGSAIDREKTEKALQRELFAPSGDPVPTLDRLLDEIRRLSWGKRSYAVSLCNTLMIKLLRGLRPKEDEWQSDEEQEVFYCLQACATLDETFGWMRSRIRAARSELEGGTKDSRLIIEIKRYIDENYQMEINLETMAARFFMNPYYFSSFFKKHTGQNFKLYLTEVRMREATHLLLHSDAMLYEIAEKTGFTNARQFSEIFKKYYGALPNDYRLSRKN
ncbi:response regulator [Paenibacillus sp. HW567]|uniref:response regulator n=1 Tax=Paenibacillus sp. HW567 TaxID=1034769 RepID=UPI00036110A0|nr:response regulator [Paenibacillus sp. HW567]